MYTIVVRKFWEKESKNPELVFETPKLLDKCSQDKKPSGEHWRMFELMVGAQKSEIAPLVIPHLSKNEFQWLSSDSIPPGEVICQICGEEILSEQATVSCKKCNTPHHKDCWFYNGKCATFACNGTTLV